MCAVHANFPNAVTDTCGDIQIETRDFHSSAVAWVDVWEDDFRTVHGVFSSRKDTHMPTPDPLGLELQEDPALPANTMVAPLQVIREIRAVLGALTVNFEVSWDSPAVRLSSDLFEAFSAWSDSQEESVDEGLFN